jgi:bifunctional non-homologous end joining protein LigD
MAAISFPTALQQPNQQNQTMITTTPHTTASLNFREGSSDKVYRTTIEAQADGYIVTFAYGRRGSMLTTGTKTTDPVTLEQAQAIHQKLVASKIAKGYQADDESGESTAPYQQSGNEGRDSGIRCQLLNPVDESELDRLLGDNQHCLQVKHDGRRLLVRKQGDEITGINRRGLVVSIPGPIRRAVEELPVDVLIDGEAVSDTLHAFDLLEVKGNDMRARGYLQRYTGLLMLLDPEHRALRPVSTMVLPADKHAMFQTFRQCGSEGVVFKDINAPFSMGRPNSGGTQLKFKFVESASFVVTGRNAKRSVSLALYDDDKLVPAGNVTIPPNHAVPAPGEVVECQFLYGFKESGSIYQPVYRGKRCDIPAAECTTDQLKYKPTSTAAA